MINMELAFLVAQARQRKATDYGVHPIVVQQRAESSHRTPALLLKTLLLRIVG